MLQPTDDIGRISSSNDTASSCSNTEGSEEEVEEGLIDTEISIAGPSQSDHKGDQKSSRSDARHSSGEEEENDVTGLPTINLLKCKQSITYQCLNIWNSLPENITNFKKLENTKNKIQEISFDFILVKYRVKQVTMCVMM